MRQYVCPYRECKAVLLLNVPPDAPANAQVPYLCAHCGQAFRAVVGQGLPLFLARVRLWVLALDDMVNLLLCAAFLYAGYRLWLAGGSLAVLAAFLVLVAIAHFDQAGISDLFFLIVLITGTVTLTGLGAYYLGHVQDVYTMLPMMGLAVLVVLALAWFGAPAAAWSPPLLPNTQYGATEILTAEQDIERTGL